MKKDETIQKRLRELHLNVSTFEVLLSVLRNTKKDKEIVVNSLLHRIVPHSEQILKSNYSVNISELDNSKICIRVTSAHGVQEVVFDAHIMEIGSQNRKPYTVDMVREKIKTMPTAGEFMVTVTRQNWSVPTKSNHLFP